MATVVQTYTATNGSADESNDISGGSSASTSFVPRGISQRSAWSPAAAGDQPLALSTPGLYAKQDLQSLVAALSEDGPNSMGALGGLCKQLFDGGHPAIEAACDCGAIEATVSLLGKGNVQDISLARGATEALFYLAADYDQTRLMIDAKGHDTMLRLVREAAPQDSTLAVYSFRLLANTLYCEDRRSPMWKAVDVGFIIDALGWVLGAGDTTPPSDEQADVLLASICDVAALWLQRLQQSSKSSGSTAEELVARQMVALIPLLLEKMAARAEDLVVIQNGFRFLYALARGCGHWPADVREPALAAMQQMWKVLGNCGQPEVRAYGAMAYEAVSSIPQKNYRDATCDLLAMD